MNGDITLAAIRQCHRASLEPTFSSETEFRPVISDGQNLKSNRSSNHHLKQVV